MIIIDDGKNWQIIFQRSHAQLAADIAYNIHSEYHPKEVPFPSLLTAIADHDDGRQQWEGRLHITAGGAPMDYRQQPLHLKIEQANKSITNSQYRSPWIGLLTSMHQVYLYEKFAKENQKVAEFIEKQEDYQERMQKLLSIKPEIQREAYSFMKLCDEMSLILCEERLDSLNNKQKIGNLQLLNNCYIYKKEQDIYTLQPWFFKDGLLNLSVFIFKVPKEKFICDETLLNTIRKTTAVEKKWQFKHPEL
jgi:hypothetical protein